MQGRLRGMTSADKGEYRQAHQQATDHNGLRRDVIRPRRVAEAHVLSYAVERDPRQCDAAPSGCCKIVGHGQAFWRGVGQPGEFSTGTVIR